MTVSTYWEDGIEWVSIAGIPYLLGSANVSRFLHVSKRQGDAWYERRRSNGHPEGLDVIVRGRHRRAFDPNEVKEWKKNYVPDKGGHSMHQPGCGCNAHAKSRQLTLW